MCCSLPHYASSRAVEATRTEGSRALGVPRQTLRAEKAWGAHHDAQHGFLTSGLITAVVAWQARRTLYRTFVLHMGEIYTRIFDIKDTSMGGGHSNMRAKDKLQ